jgi:hypothetical protein
MLKKGEKIHGPLPNLNYMRHAAIQPSVNYLHHTVSYL